MHQLYVIGIGAGDPEQVTVQAISALNEVDVFFVADKGPATEELVELRSQICRRYINAKPYRFVQVQDPERDRRTSLTSGQYREVVLDWHEARAAAWESAMLAELAPGQTAGFLVWGDPALYDSIIRIVDRVRERGVLPLQFRVIPGISSVAQLAAAHRIVLNRIGEPVHITTGRRLRGGLPPDQHNVVVMLDANLVCRHFAEPDLQIYWGAYLGTTEELLIAGSLAEVIDEIVRVRAAAKARRGWIMDTYLVRRPLPSAADG